MEKHYCDRCGMLLGGDTDLKGGHSYKFSYEFDSEPYINTAHPKIKTGVLCYSCAKSLNIMLSSDLPYYDKRSKKEL